MLLCPACNSTATGEDKPDVAEAALGVIAYCISLHNERCAAKSFQIGARACQAFISPCHLHEEDNFVTVLTQGSC